MSVGRARPTRGARLALRRRRPGALCALAAAAVVSACSGVSAPDLFIVYRTGSTPQARLTLLVDEEGGVTCNGRLAAQKLSDPQIIKAREIQEDLAKPAASHLSLAPRPGSVFAYYVRDENGSVRFSDNSARQPAVLQKLQLFVLQSAQDVCHLAQ
jgi:hypothetical protein